MALLFERRFHLGVDYATARNIGEVAALPRPLQMHTQTSGQCIHNGRIEADSFRAGPLTQSPLELSRQI